MPTEIETSPDDTNSTTNQSTEDAPLQPQATHTPDANGEQTPWPEQEPWQFEQSDDAEENPYQLSSSNDFSALSAGQAQNPKQVLEHIFGYGEFRGAQEEIINTLVSGDDALVLMPTGGGKSLCYQIPALVRPGTGIVVSPLIALMQDQVSALLEQGVNAAFLNSSMTFLERQQVEQQLYQGNLDILYVAPERLVQPQTIEILKQITIALFAIDEAHCVSQWGHDFRSDYLRLSFLAEQFPKTPLIALTATADVRTRNEIVSRLGLSEAKLFISSFDRPNIRYHITEKLNPKQQLLNFINKDHFGDAGIVYCMTRKKVDEMAQHLRDNNFNALAYHAGLSNEVRSDHQARFLKEEAVIIVATVAFGMGIDKPDVRFVAHLDLPKSMEAYYQETGRAGRDGGPSNAWMVYGLRDVIGLKQIMANSEAGEEHKRVERQKLEALLGFCEATTCRRQIILNYFEETSEPCGNCDNCIDPPGTWDATTDTQKALSCVYRTGQRFGVSHVIDVLQGKATPKVTQQGHDSLSTFGIGASLDAKQWNSLFRQLVAMGYLRVDFDRYGALVLTEEARPVLKGQQQLQLRKLSTASQNKRISNTGPQEAYDDPADILLWDELRALRKRLSQEHDIPPYTVFHDASLHEMVNQRPINLQQLMTVHGVGDKKLKTYGEEFLAVIRKQTPGDHGEIGTPASKAKTTKKKSAIDGSAAYKTLTLIKQGLSVESIAIQSGIKERTVYGHLAHCIRERQIEPDECLPISSESIETITDAWLALPESQQNRLRPLHEALGGAFDYETLGCVHAWLEVHMD